jgi:hypothetical protein
MNRRFLAAAVALAPLLAAGVCSAQSTPTQITTATTTPVQTATIAGGQPNDLDITTTGSVSPTVAGTAVTLNSNNNVSSEGTISFSNVDNATGLQIDGGFTGQVTITGPITVNETYTAPTSTITGIPYGNWASGGNRIGILVTGAGAFNGSITDTGAMTVQGNNSEGILINAPITGDLMMLTVTPPVAPATTPAVAAGSISVTGNGVVGLDVTPNGAVEGTGGPGGFGIRINQITARGTGAQAVAIDGAVAGTVNISGAVSATGFFSTARPTNPALSVQYPASDFQEGGPAVAIGANLGKGLLISAPPFPLSTTNLDQDNDGVPDASQGTGSVSSFGAAPALQIGSKTQSVELGEAGTGANGYGLVIQGSVSANGVYDPLFTPFLPAVVPATAVQIGGQGGVATILDGGLHNTGTILATAFQADATSIHLSGGASVPSLVNDGSIAAASTQVNSLTTATPANGSTPAIPAPVAVNVTGILIDPGASVPSISNSLTIAATITGSAGVGGTAAGIIDNSGSLATVNNTGNIVASLNQTVANTPMPGNLIGIDMASGTGPQSITQGLSAVAASAQPFSVTTAYTPGQIVSENSLVFEALAATTAGQDPVGSPSLWKQVGTQAPSIVGSIQFGNGGSTLTVTAGTIVAGPIVASLPTSGVIDLGAGVNTLTVNGVPASDTGGVLVPGTAVVGFLKDEGNYTLTLNVLAGTLADSNPGLIHANSVNVGANGALLIAADPANKINTTFMTAGASTFATGAQVGLTLLSVQSAPTADYVILQTTGLGTLSVGTFGSSALLNNAPFLYTASPSFIPNTTGGGGQIDLTVTRKTQAQLGFNNAEQGALDAVLAAVPNDANIQAAILAPTTEASFKAVYDQLLPEQGQGIFDALDAAAQHISSLTGTNPDPNATVAGSSLWLQEVNERVSRSGIETLGSEAQILGLVGGYERMGLAGGALGVTLAYFNAAETDSAAAVGEHVLGSMVEGSLYYRRAAGPFTFSARGGVGYSWFSSDRRFLASASTNTVGASNVATAAWGGVFFDGHMGAAYEQKFGRYYARPELSVDYLRLSEGAQDESGGGAGFDLNTDPRTSTRFSGQAIVALGEQWGKAQWLRTEVRFGYREIFAGDVGDTTSVFAGGAPFTLAADPDKGGWATVGFSIKGGTEFSYLALEGDIDFREGEQRYDLRVAGRSMF